MCICIPYNIQKCTITRSCSCWALQEKLCFIMPVISREMLPQPASKNQVNPSSGTKNKYFRKHGNQSGGNASAIHQTIRRPRQQGGARQGKRDFRRDSRSSNNNNNNNNNRQFLGAVSWLGRPSLPVFGRSRHNFKTYVGDMFWLFLASFLGFQKTR